MELKQLEGSVLAERFKLERLLGQGGYGAVFEAEQLSVGRRCAIKVIMPDRSADKALIERFRVEARQTSRLSDPHSVTVYDFGHDEERGLLFLAMEFLDGEDLNTRLVEGGPFDLSLVVQVVEQASQSLQEAHDLGMVHRDIKPPNIMLIRKGGRSDFVKVIDFGIAKAMQSSPMTYYELTAAGMMIGTPRYMSPEQILGESMDGRTDQYALALTAYKMLTGRTPFDGESTFDIANSQVNDSPLPPGAYRRELARYPRLEDVLLKALNKTPRDRFATIREFGEAMRAGFTEKSGLKVAQGASASAVAPVKSPAPSLAEAADGFVEPRREGDRDTHVQPAPGIRRGTSGQEGGGRAFNTPIMGIFALSFGIVVAAAFGALWKMTNQAVPSPQVQELEVEAKLESKREEPARTAPALDKGRVQVQISPGAVLYVGGVAYSDEVEQVIELPVGEHLLSLRVDDQTLGRKTVDVQPGSLTMVELLAR